MNETWDIGTPLPTILASGKHGSISVLGKVELTPESRIECQIFFRFRKKTPILWFASAIHARGDSSPFAYQTWKRFNGDQAWLDMIERMMTYEEFRDRYLRYGGDPMSRADFDLVCTTKPDSPGRYQAIDG